MGVIIIRSAAGVTIGPPAERLYPVDPVGVETITPSPRKEAACTPFTLTLTEISLERPLLGHDDSRIRVKAGGLAAVRHGIFLSDKNLPRTGLPDALHQARIALACLLGILKDGHILKS